MISLYSKKAGCSFPLLKTAGYNWLICNERVHGFSFHSLLRFWIFFLLFNPWTCVSGPSPQATFVIKYFDNLNITMNFFYVTITHYWALWTQSKSSKKEILMPGIEPGSRRWERRIVTTRPRGICAVVERLFVTAQSSGIVLTSHWLKISAA